MISPSSLTTILRLLEGGVWRARTAPFEVIDWVWGGAARPGDAGPPSAFAAEPEAMWESRIYPPDLPLFQSAVDAFVAGPGAEAPLDYRIIVRDGELLWLRQWLLEKRPCEDEPGRYVVTGFVRVVTEEKRLQWEIMRTSEDERSRIGQEIHDDVCQILAGINYLIHVVQQRLQAERPAEAAELESINQEIQAGLERTRALAHGLLPAKSNFNTLSQALRDLSRQVATRFKLKLSVKLPADPPAYSRERLLHIYRIVQEAASNSFKHGRASAIEVSLAARDGRHVLTIEDNGRGLPPDTSRAEGVGLNVMRNRAQLLGGSLEVGNGRTGARIELHLPLQSET